jgi:hypothetical protein
VHTCLNNRGIRRTPTHALRGPIDRSFATSRIGFPGCSHGCDLVRGMPPCLQKESLAVALTSHLLTH